MSRNRKKEFTVFQKGSNNKNIMLNKKQILKIKMGTMFNKFVKQ